MAKISRTFCLTDKALEKITEYRESHNCKSDSEALESIILNEVKVNTNDLKALVTSIVTSILNNNQTVLSSIEPEKTKQVVDVEVDKVYKKSLGDIYSDMPD